MCRDHVTQQESRFAVRSQKISVVRIFRCRMHKINNGFPNNMNGILFLECGYWNTCGMTRLADVFFCVATHCFPMHGDQSTRTEPRIHPWSLLKEPFCGLRSEAAKRPQTKDQEGDTRLSGFTSCDTEMRPYFGR